MSCNNVNVEPTILSSPIDAFGRLRVSNPLTIFDSSNVLSKGTKFDEALTGSGTVSYSQNKSTVNLNVSTASGDKVIRQSKRVMSYQPGKSLLNLFTFVMNAQTANLKQKMGMFDAKNGVFFEDTGTQYQFVRRTYVTGTATDNAVAQSSWNGDKLDGTGASGITLNPTKASILWMDFEWLGMGSVRCGFVIDGKFIVAHTFNNANNLDTVYMQTANLPHRFEIETTGTIGAAATLQQVCCSCMSEGGYAPFARQKVIRTAALTGVTLGTAGTFYNIATIRIKTGRPYAVIIPVGVDVLNISNVDYEYGLFINATPSSAFSYTSFDDNVEYDLTTVDLTATGTQIACGYLGGKTAPSAFGGAGFIAFDYQLGQTIAGVSETMTLAVRASSPSSKVAGQFKWIDLTN
jgi:hypothetical protein